jgi:hypothetical protein
MALTLDRTAYNLLVDDDGSNLVGTVWTKNQVKTVLLDPIDAVLATLADPVGVAHGGTGIASYTIGDLLYASGATTLAKRAAVAVGQVLVSGGVGVAPAWSATPVVTTLTAEGVTVQKNFNGTTLFAVTNTDTTNTVSRAQLALTAGNVTGIFQAAHSSGFAFGSVTVHSVDVIIGNSSAWRFDTAGNLLDLAAHLLLVGGPIQTAGYYQGTEMTAPAAGAVNTGRIYFEDNGSGKTRLMCLFNTGAAQQIAIQP